MVRPARLSAAQRRLILAACCVGASWGVWLWIGLASFDPFDDSLLGWLVLTVGVAGTVCGLVVYVVALLVIWLRLVIRRSASAS
jgi:hypothetical protein